MSLIAALVVGALILFVRWCIDPKEFAKFPRLNRVQNVLTVLFVIYLVVGGIIGLGSVFSFDLTRWVLKHVGGG